MADAIIVIIVLIVLILAVKGSVKHFKGEGPCCGGGSGSAKKAGEKMLDGPVIGRKTVKISGMHCDNCVNSVTNAINKIDGASARVSLSDNLAVVSYDREVSEIDIKHAVEDAGFEVVSIS
ncbi:heavy metal-associated domain protein [Marvinbryantia formatexigens DSM 14469]|uniref:Heavy metal-associated domain protein n=1 Tax=Marvinbryantia formatexigens DSM 14469 TaxID=478749 RepID=C6LIF7_9FIRM|nr:heavy metal-associated domain-containing protein [Marvinbryantia formatexigens]EET59539.1 heavy metal-associated domain protein [Marvinbryantia formatexigens DSM 14469]UWO26341.1 heavy-metal-associated domain-containing protein [Marvinbryantia formatexigens DSM 14469]SDG06943.1 Copper chaperone CopZ [Marvinbryantia formatexigens]